MTPPDDEEDAWAAQDIAYDDERDAHEDTSIRDEPEHDEEDADGS